MAVGRQSLASEVIMSPKQEKLQNVRLAHLRKDKGEPTIKATWHKKGKHWEHDTLYEYFGRSSSRKRLPPFL